MSKPSYFKFVTAKVIVKTTNSKYLDDQVCAL